MKTLFGIIAVAFSLFLISCEKDEMDINSISVEGIYTGSLIHTNSLKSATGGDHDGTAEVSNVSNGQIQVHCYGGELDTTFMLNYYEDNNNVRVCLTGNAFQNEYGHMMSSNGTWGGMHGGMMGHSNGNQTAWGNHMQDNHQSGDEHFGSFNMDNHSFNYTIKTKNGDYEFSGTRQ